RGPSPRRGSGGGGGCPGRRTRRARGAAPPGRGPRGGGAGGGGRAWEWGAGGGPSADRARRLGNARRGDVDDAVAEAVCGGGMPIVGLVRVEHDDLAGRADRRRAAIMERVQ